MKRSSIFAAILATVLFGGPVIACVMPDAQLTAEERQCCKEMGGSCQLGQSGMPMSHSCCKIAFQSRSDCRPSSTNLQPVPVLVVAFLKPPAEFFSPNQSLHALWLRQSHSPPGEATHAASPLRI